MASDSQYQGQLPQPAASMAPPQKPRDTKKLDINSLMSPPDPILDSFNNAATRNNYATAHPTRDDNASTTPTDGTSGKQPLPMSPPISPYSQPIATSEPAPTPLTPPSQPVKDPLLYPQDDNHSTSSPAHSPLFAATDLDEHQRLVDQHLRNRSPAIFSGLSPPRREDYELILTFRSQVMRHFTSNRKGWLRQERALLQADKSALGAKRYHRIMPAKPIAVKPSKTGRVDRVSKPSAAPRPIRAGGSGNAMAGAVRPSGRASATPDPSRRIVAPNREDKDFESLPDFCPPLDSLPSKPNSLKVDWKGSPIDLSGDPFASLLHGDELLLAGNLRLDCATYLTSKRRMFMRRLECVGIGKEFRKTDAQQACKIDVNKASKLWTAFDRVGWLNEKWMRPHMHRLKELK